MSEFTATCHTEGCPNAGYTLTLEFDPENPPGGVVCGACGQPIEDVHGLPEPPPES